MREVSISPESPLSSGSVKSGTGLPAASIDPIIVPSFLKVRLEPIATKASIGSGSVSVSASVPSSDSALTSSDTGMGFIGIGSLSGESCQAPVFPIFTVRLDSAWTCASPVQTPCTFTVPSLPIARVAETGPLFVLLCLTENGNGLEDADAAVSSTTGSPRYRFTHSPVSPIVISKEE